MAGNAAERRERWERSLPIVKGEPAVDLIRRAAALGVRLAVHPGGRLWADKLDRLPPELREGLGAHRAAVVAALTAPPNPARSPDRQSEADESWRALPFGTERGHAMNKARLSAGACSCCAGRRW